MSTPASTAQAAGILRSGCPFPSSSLGLEHVYVHVGGQQMPLVASRCRWRLADAVGGQQMPLVASRCRWWPADAVGRQQMPLVDSRCRWLPADAVGGQRKLLAAPYAGPYQMGERQEVISFGLPESPHRFQPGVRLSRPHSQEAGRSYDPACFVPCGGHSNGNRTWLLVPVRNNYVHVNMPARNKHAHLHVSH